MNKKFNKEEEIETKPYHYCVQPITRTVHHFYISSVVEEPTLYTDMIHKIQTAGPDDVVYLHLNTPGGRLDTGTQLINAMNTTQAHVIASLEGEVASLGTMLFLAAHEFVVHDNSLLMFHNYTGGVWGKGHEQVAALESATRWTDDFMRRLYIPFMSDAEVTRLIKGEDIYMHPPEIRTRLDKMVKVLEKEAIDREPIDPSTKKKKTNKKTISKKS